MLRDKKQHHVPLEIPCQKQLVLGYGTWGHFLPTISFSLFLRWISYSKPDEITTDHQKSHRFRYFGGYALSDNRWTYRFSPSMAYWGDFLPHSRGKVFPFFPACFFVLSRGRFEHFSSLDPRSSSRDSDMAIDLPILPNILHSQVCHHNHLRG